MLRDALNCALRWGFIQRNAATLVDPPRISRTEVRPLTREQTRQFLDAVAGDRFESLYLVAIATGLRQGELLGLQWNDVDLNGGTVRVRHSLQRVTGTLTLVEPKTERSRRTVKLPAIALSALHAQRRRQAEARLLAGSRWRDSGFVFATTIGTPLDATNVTHAFRRALLKAGLPRQRFHDLRHTAASLLLLQGVHPRVVMDVLGHSQISLTMNTYAHVMPALQHEAADRMDSVLRG